MAVVYLTKADVNASPTRAGFGFQGATVSEEILVRGGDEKNCIIDLLGDCAAFSQIDDNWGGLDRALPKAHPQYDWCYATAIESMVGMGGNQSFYLGTNDEGQVVGEALKLVPAATDLAVPPYTGLYVQHPVYRLSVRFEALPYQMFDNDSITVQAATAYDDDGLAYQYWYPDGEWLRFTDYEIAPSAELITAQQGQSLFVTSTDPVAPPGTSPPHGFTFSGFPRILIAKSAIKFRWYRIPWFYVSSAASHLRAGLGHVNYEDWYDWKAGELLYSGLLVERRYTSPLPSRATDWGGKTTYNVLDKFCDVALLFEQVDRGSPQVPDFSLVANANRNIVAAGMNLTPWFGDRQFYMTVFPGGPKLSNSGTATAGNATTLTLANTASNTNGFYNGMQLRLTGGTGAGQAGTVTAYNGSTRVATVTSNFATPPAANTQYTLYTNSSAELNDVTRWRPTFPSFPFQRLFCSPTRPIEYL